MMDSNDISRSRCDVKRWFVFDALGMFFSIVTYTLLFYAFSVYFIFYIYPNIASFLGFLNFLVFTVLILMCYISHFKAMTTNPGTLTPNAFNLENYTPTTIPKHCTRCKSIKLAQSHHCRICGYCVRKMDHHCPWINNCVGEDNLKYFMLFTWYITCVSLYVLIVLSFKLFNCTEECTNNMAQFTMTMGLIVEAITFLLFTTVILGTQMANIYSNETGIDSLKNELVEDDGLTMYQRLSNVCGGTFGLTWFLPFIPDNAQPFRPGTHNSV